MLRYIASSLTTVNNSDFKDICGIYQYSSDPNVYICTLENSQYQIITREGIKISVLPDSPDNELILVVRVIPDTSEAYPWFEKCFGENKEPIPLEIYYIDSFGNKVAVNDEVKIEIPSSIKEAYYLTTDEEITKIDFDISSHVIVVAKLKNRYVVLFSKTVSGIKPDNESMLDKDQTKTVSPNTGYIYSKEICLAASMISVVFAVIFFVLAKKRSYSQERK